MFRHFFNPKRQRVIEAVINYYEGNSNEIPYNSSEIKEAMEWLNNNEMPNKEMLLARLNMALLITQSK